jgi:DNA repair protein RadC
MPKIKDLPENQRPREKLLQFGPESLSDKELLAILIGHGIKGKSAIEMAEELLVEYKDLKGLAGKRLDEFMKIKGIKEAKIIKIAIAFEIAKRLYFT